MKVFQSIWANRSTPRFYFIWLLLLCSIFFFGCKENVDVAEDEAAEEDDLLPTATVEFDRTSGFSAGTDSTQFCVRVLGVTLFDLELQFGDLVLPLDAEKEDGACFTVPNINDDDLADDLPPGDYHMQALDGAIPLFPTAEFEILATPKPGEDPGPVQSGAIQAEFDVSQPTNEIDILLTLLGEDQQPITEGIEPEMFELLDVRFLIYIEEEERFDPVCFLSTDAEPLSINPLAPPATGLVVDKSGSMRGNMQLVREAAEAFGEGYLVDPDTVNEIALGYFPGSNPLYGPWTILQDLTSDLDTYLAAVPLIPEAGGGTPLYSTILGLIDYLVDNAPDRTLIGVAMTDGFANNPGLIGETIEKALANDVRIITVGLGTSVNEQELRNVADSTGGNFVQVLEPEDLEEAFQGIALALAAEFRLTALVTTPDLEPGRYLLTATLRESRTNPEDPVVIPISVPVVIPEPTP
jgi:hypothetical protein